MIKKIKLLLVFYIIISSPFICVSGEPIDLNSVISEAENGDAYYQGVLGAIYRRGEFGEIDYDIAYKWALLSSENGNPIGIYNLAVLYESGLIVEKDLIKANELYLKAYKPMLELALQGDHRAQVNLGYILEMGIGGNADLQEALKWYERAASLGDARAQFILGYKYYHGWGYKRDYSKAVEWFTKAADQNNLTAQHFLGNLYINGEGVLLNYNEAVNWHRSAERFQYNTETVSGELSSYIMNGVTYKGDEVIPGLLPPMFRMEIIEGSCGEACIWSLINSDIFTASQIEINIAGGSPGRGLHSYELYKALDEFGIHYEDNVRKTFIEYGIAYLNPFNLFLSRSDEYRKFLYDVII